MNKSFYTIFDTKLGACGIAWNERGVTAFQLPEATRQQTESRIARNASATRAKSVPKKIAGIIKRAQKHLAGDAQDFRDVAVDLDNRAEFSKRVYAVCHAIPSGRTMSYGEIAKLVKRPGASRAVGQAMGKNPIPLIIPCHRVLASGNRPGGFSAYGGFATKEKLLALEGVTIGPPAVMRTRKDLAAAVAKLKKQDPKLGAILSRPIEFRLRPEHSPYQTLVEAVVHQQLSPKAASTILGRIMHLYSGAKIPSPAELLKTADELLRKAGLSRSKTKAVKDIAAKTLDGTVPSSKEIAKLGNEEIIARLTSIYGVGRWTVEMMLIFTLGRMDVWPVDDFALRKIAAAVFALKSIPTPKQLDAMGEAWKPYRTVASLYLWNQGDNRPAS